MTSVTNPQENDYNMVVADNLRAELSRARWTGRKAAAALGLTSTYVSRRVSGETPLTPNDIVMFANFLEVPIADLFQQSKKAPAATQGRAGAAGMSEIYFMGDAIGRSTSIHGVNVALYQLS